MWSECLRQGFLLFVLGLFVHSLLFCFSFSVFFFFVGLLVDFSSVGLLPWKIPHNHPRKQTLWISSQSLQWASPSILKSQVLFPSLLHNSTLTWRDYSSFNCYHSCVYQLLPNKQPPEIYFFSCLCHGKAVWQFSRSSVFKLLYYF